MTAAVNRLDTLLKSHPMPTWRKMAWPIMTLITLAVLWANFAKLDEVSSSQGEVVPLGKTKVIQHLEGGVVEDIFVKEGDVVRKDQVLLRLDIATTGSKIDELRTRLDSELLIRARLEAEANGTEPVFPPDVAARVPVEARSQQNAFDARARQLESGLQVIRELVKQRQLEVRELEARLQSIQANLRVAEEQLKIHKDLEKSGLASRVDVLQYETEVQTLQGELSTIQSSIPRARAAVSETTSRLDEQETKFRREAQEELSKTEQQISQVSELLKKATEQGVRAEIKSPTDGVVKNMAITGTSNVVKPGEAIMEIVPTGESLVVEARLNPSERGYVTEGQQALVKISTYDFARYGGLDGVVTMVAPDTSTDDKGNVYFRVLVKPDKSYLGPYEGSLPIMPGMEATVDIHTGQKTVMDYLVKPVLKLKHEAFRER